MIDVLNWTPESTQIASRASGFILCILNLKLPCLCLRNWLNMTTENGAWHGKRTVLWPGIQITSNDLILVDHCYRITFTTNSLSGISIWVLQHWYGFCFWIKPDKPAKKNTLRMGIFGWPSASFSAATPRRFSAVSCASKEATTMDSSDATWHQTCTYGSQSAIELPKNPHTCCSDCNSCWPQLTAYQRTTKQPSWNMVKPCENSSFRASGQSRNP